MKFLIGTFLLLVAAQTYSQSCVMEGFDDEVVNTGASLKEIEQKKLLEGQCKVYQKEFRRRAKKKGLLRDAEYNRAQVLCGKWTFLNLGMRTDIGIPVRILKTMEKFDGVGPKLKGLGFMSDESWKNEPYPFGVVPVGHERPLAFKRTATNRIVQMSCAACHTGELPDGRFSLGATNENLDYGKFNLYTMFSVWMVDKKKNDPKRWLPEVASMYRELEKKNKSPFLSQLKLVEYFPFNSGFIKHVIGEEPAPLETQRSFLNGERGIYNGFAPSINFDDRQIYLSAPQLYEAGKYNEAHYGSLAGLESMDDFVSEALVYTNRSTRYNTKMYIDPIKEFIRCLKAPENPGPKHVERLAQGKELFQNRCMSCHDLPDGGGSVAQDMELMGSPKSYVDLFLSYRPTEVQSKVTFNLLNELKISTSVDTLKVRRLNGIWTRRNLTSNGQVKGLDHLFCVGPHERSETSREDAKTQGIHRDLCTDYTPDEKEALIEVLKHWN